MAETTQIQTFLARLQTARGEIDAAKDEVHDTLATIGAATERLLPALREFAARERAMTGHGATFEILDGLSQALETLDLLVHQGDEMRDALHIHLLELVASMRTIQDTLVAWRNL